VKGPLFRYRRWLYKCYFRRM